MLMSSTMTPNPLAKQDTNSITSMSMRWAGEASGTRASGTVNTKQPATYTIPAPSRDVSHLHSTEPRIPPMAPAPMTMPSSPALTPRTRTA